MFWEILAVTSLAMLILLGIGLDAFAMSKNKDLRCQANIQTMIGKAISFFVQALLLATCSSHALVIALAILYAISLALGVYGLINVEHSLAGSRMTWPEAIEEALLIKKESD